MQLIGVADRVVDEGDAVERIVGFSERRSGEVDAAPEVRLDEVGDVSGKVAIQSRSSHAGRRLDEREGLH